MVESALGAALVTGAASGIGRATTFLALHYGYDVVAVDREQTGLEELAARARERGGGGRLITCAADVTDVDGLRAAVVASRTERGKFTAMVSCAGIEVIADIATLTSAEWKRCLDVNLTGTFHSLQVALPELLDTRGAVVMVASDAGITGAQGYAAYCASKHGVIGLMKAAALDLGPRGVRVNAVAPGFVETPMAARIFDGDRSTWDYYQSTVPLGRFGQPDEIAKTILYLAGAESSYVTGAVLSIDGGSTAGYFDAAAQAG